MIDNRKELSKMEITDVPSLKRWLSMYDNLRREIACQNERLNKLQEKIGMVGGPNTSGMPSNPSETNDRRADIIAAVIDLQKEVNGLYEYYNRITEDIESVIRFMTVPEERAVMRTRYIDAMKWNDICDVLFNKEEDYYDRLESYQRRTYLIHGTALKSFVEASIEHFN